MIDSKWGNSEATQQVNNMILNHFTSFNIKATK